MNCNTQNAKIAGITEESLIIGVDIGSEIHFARAFDWRGFEYSKKAFQFSNSDVGFNNFRIWMHDLQVKHQKTVVIPGMEPTGHYWFNLGIFLQEQGIKPVLVNPHHVKKSKELDDNNPTKNDRKDPKVIAGLVSSGRFSYPYIPEGVYADLRITSNLRFQAQKELNRVLNRIARWLSIYFPEYKDVYGKRDSISGMMILRQASLPSDIVALGVEGVNKIWRDAKLRAVGIKRATILVEAAKRSVGSREGVIAARMEIVTLLEDYETYSARVNDLLQLIEDMISEIPHVEKLLEIKGVGMKTVSGFIAEVGDISRFDNPKQLQKLAGLAIVENSSGKHKGKTKISKRGRKRLRYLLFEVAMSVVSKNDEFGTLHYYYTNRRDNPLKKIQSLIAIACKLIRVFFVIMTKGISYDGDKLLADIKRPAMLATAV
ncbi:MAG: IS110 family transposase [Lachnospiraceae bacterium]|nr:IS110 family transposase [Lachnospiraceae bacterium]